MADGRDRKKARVMRPPVSQAVLDWRANQARIRDAAASASSAMDAGKPSALAGYTPGSFHPRNPPRYAPWYQPNQGQAAANAATQGVNALQYNPQMSAANAVAALQQPRYKAGSDHDSIMTAMQEAKSANNYSRPQMHLGHVDSPTQKMQENFRSGRYIYSGIDDPRLNPTREGLEGGPDTIAEGHKDRSGRWRYHPKSSRSRANDQINTQKKKPYKRLKKVF